jgi:hypothetical protein
MQNAVYNIKISGNLGSKLNNTIPSTIPHGYFLPLIFLPPTSKTVLLPTTANGIRYKKKKKWKIIYLLTLLLSVNMWKIGFPSQAEILSAMGFKLL